MHITLTIHFNRKYILPQAHLPRAYYMIMLCRVNCTDVNVSFNSKVAYVYIVCVYLCDVIMNKKVKMRFYLIFTLRLRLALIPVSSPPYLTCSLITSGTCRENMNQIKTYTHSTRAHTHNITEMLLRSYKDDRYCVT